jgi:hypothetical protein
MGPIRDKLWAERRKLNMETVMISILEPIQKFDEGSNHLQGCDKVKVKLSLCFI